MTEDDRVDEEEKNDIAVSFILDIFVLKYIADSKERHKEWRSYPAARIPTPL